MDKSGIFPVVLTLLLCACAPLQQAPLVYSSGQTIGIRVGVAPTQPDTAEIVIGYKSLDAAYAPVAVARPETLDKEFLEKTSAETRRLFEIKEIYGVFGEELTPDTVKKLNPDEIKEISSYLEKLGAQKDAEKAKKDADGAWEVARKSLEEAKAKNQAIEDTKKYFEENKAKINESCPNASRNADDMRGFTCPEGKTSIELTELQKLLAKSAKASEAVQIDSLSKQLNDANSKKNEAKSALGTADANLATARDKGLDALQKLANVRKKDALSVYGSFDADTSGKKNEAGLKLGKVFSTGVAAQNLTEAEKTVASMSALGQCITSASQIITKMTDDEAKRAKLLEATIEQCGNAAGQMQAKNKN